jgi:hypothetical protein
MLNYNWIDQIGSVRFMMKGGDVVENEVAAR